MLKMESVVPDNALYDWIFFQQYWEIEYENTAGNSRKLVLKKKQQKWELLAVAENMMGPCSNRCTVLA